MAALRFVVATTCIAAASATGAHTRGATTRAGVLTALTQNEHLKDVDPTFECAWRKLAFEFAQQLQPWRPASAFADIHDGLELSTQCNLSFVAPAPSGALAAAPAPAATTLYVDFVHGSDANSGSQASPMQHVAFAVAAARALPQPAAIVLRDGVHRLTETLQLGADDRGLSISAFPGEAPVLSSGLVLQPKWVPVALSDVRGASSSAGAVRPAAGSATRDARLPSSTAPCVWTTFADEDGMWGDWPSSSVHNTSTAPSAAACEARCKSYGPTPCYSWTWYDNSRSFGNEWDGKCFLRTDSVWSPSAQAHTFAGYCVAPPMPPNVFVADLSATPIPDNLVAPASAALTLFFSPDGGRSTQRAFRARYPNADLEVDLFPKGWSSGAARTKPVCDPSSYNVTHVPLPNNYGPGMFSDYYFGEGSTCDRFEDSEWLHGPSTVSYWCQPNGRTAGCTYLVHSPTAFTFSPADLPHAPYASDLVANGAVVQYWRDGHWFSMMVHVGSVDVDAANSTTLTFDRGAFQGAEGDENGEDWYIEHVKEELDAPREFFYERAVQKLYYFHNATSGTPPPASWTWEVPTLKCLVNISGTPAAPAVGISLSGITFTSAAASYLAAHGIPSGGDWGLSRMGAILVSGAEQVTIASNTFSRLDGNGVFLSGYTRNVTIDRNEFVWMGESAVASWGFTDGVDATAGTQPWYTSVTNNLCHEIGHYEKQVSCYFAATSASAEISNNIMYNMPRAAVNFNDDMAGGSKLLHNLIWNTCRESQDHGPFNSWGRVPYLFPWPNGTISGGIKAQYDELAFNFIVAGGGANGGSFDHDDGSSFYIDHDNFEVYGGHKSDFDGHAKRSFNNIHAYSNVYGTKCTGIMNLPHAAENDFFAEAYSGNKCILAADAPYLELGSGCVADATLANRILLGKNEIYTPSASASISCGKSFTFAEWMALGLDAGSTIAALPTSDTIIGWARETLGMPPAAV